MHLARIPHLTAAALVGLFVLAAAMFVAMLVGTEPHPPAVRGPYLGAAMALALTSVWLLVARERAGLWLGLVTALAFVPGVGPQKFFTEPAAVALAPLIVVGTACVLAVLVTTVRGLWAGHWASPKLAARPAARGAA